MAEIARIKPNGLTVATFFAGAGGSSLGYRLAGYRVLYANEFVPIAQESYKANAAPGTVVDGRDVRQVTAAEVLKACKLKAGELDVLDGSPPCQAFSTAGRREKGWGKDREYAHGAKQKNEELFTDFVRLRDGIRPRVFVAENVSGLVKGTAKGFFLEILAELRRGYRVVCPLLDAQWLGVPQARQRIVFIGVRDDLGVDPPVPRPLPYFYSVRDALPWIGRAVHDSGGKFKSAGDVTQRPSNTIIGGAKNVGHFQVEDRVVHQTHGQHKSQGDVSDRPSPVIVSRPASFAVERIEVVGKKNAPHSRKGERRSVDQPTRTLTARRANVELQTSNVKLITAGNERHTEAGRRPTWGVDQPSPTIMASVPSASYLVETRKLQNGDTVPENVAATIEGYAIGREWDKLNPGQQSDKFFSLVRPSADEPCPTITASAVGSGKAGGPGNTASVTHPFEKRKFTILEVKRLCSFPDDFELKGTYGQQWERLGNSVPPLMMRAVAEVLRDAVLLPARRSSPAASTAARRRRSAGRSTSD